MGQSKKVKKPNQPKKIEKVKNANRLGQSKKVKKPNQIQKSWGHKTKTNKIVKALPPKYFFLEIQKQTNTKKHTNTLKITCNKYRKNISKQQNVSLLLSLRRYIFLFLS